MPIVKTLDTHGHTLRLLNTARTGDNYNVAVFAIPGFQQELEINVVWDTWEARNDDVILCAYPKSGTHWIWEIISMLLNGTSERINASKDDYMLEAICKQTFDNMPSPRVLNTHVYYRHLPPDFRRKHCKLVYIMRNPKDVAVSFYNHHTRILDYGYKGEWKDYLSRFIEGKVDYGSWFNYIVDWNKEMDRGLLNPVHLSTYEDVKKDCATEIRRLAKFLNVGDDEHLFRSIAKSCSFEIMKKDKDSLEDNGIWKDNNPGIYRKGQVGDWKNWFTVSQNEMFDCLCTEKLWGINVPLQYST